MVVGVWELVLFLWSHPIISCMVLLLFSPPFFPIIVYFSPLLICTGLVAIAMVSMNMGGSAEPEEDSRDGMRRYHEPAVHVEMQLKPVKESWLEWVKKLEGRAKAWVESRLLNQEKWQVGNITSHGILQRGFSTPVLEVTSGAEDEHESMAVDNDVTDDPRVWSRRELLNPPAQLTSSDIHALAKCHDSIPHELAEVAEASKDKSYYSFAPQTEEIRPVLDAQCSMEDSPFEASSTSLELQLPTRVFAAPLVAEPEIVKGEILFLSPIMEEECLPVARDENVSNKEILPAPKDESLDAEPPLSEEESEPLPSDKSTTEVASVLSKEVLPPAGIDENVFNFKASVDGPLLLSTTDESLADVLTMKSGEESTAFVNDNDHVDKFEPLILAYGTPSGDAVIPMSTKDGTNDLLDETRKFPTSADPHGSHRRAVEVVRSSQLKDSDGGRQARPEAEMRVFAASDDELDCGIADGFNETEKIIIVDELSRITTVNSRILEAESDRIETSPIQKSGGQIFVETGLLLDRSSEEGLDENIEACNSVPSTTTAAAALQVSELLQLVSRSGLADNLPSNESNELIQSAPYRSEFESPPFCEEKIEPVISPLSNDAAVTTAARSVLDKSQSLNATSARGEEDDLTERFFALKKSMSLITKRQEEPITLRPAEPSTNATVVPVFSPGKITRVERDPLAKSLVFPEKQKPRPRISSGAVESVEAITARLQKKFTPNWAKEDTIITSVKEDKIMIPVKDTIIGPEKEDTIINPEKEDTVIIPVKEDTIIIPVKEEDRNRPMSPPTTAIVPAVPIECDKNNEEVKESPIMPPGDDAPAVQSGLPATPETPNSKKLMSSFLSRRRERLMSPLMEAFSNSSAGDRGKKVSSGTTSTDEVATAQDRDEGSTTTPGRLLKGKMMSPLKRVFSMDANSGGSSKKVDAGRVSSLSPSPAKDKQSVKDRSKDRLMKLFSFDGRGSSKLEMGEAEKLAILGTSLRKSKSVSTNSRQKVEVGEEESVPVQGQMLLSPTHISGPLAEGKEVERLEVESEKEVLPRIGKESPDETGEVELQGKLEQRPPSSPEKKLPPTTDESLRGADESAAAARGVGLNKPSQEKKFSLSWTKKKRSSEPLDPLTARLTLPEEKVSLSGKSNDEDSGPIFKSPLRRFNSSPPMNNPVVDRAEDTDTAAPLYENYSLDTGFVSLSLKHRESPKAASDKRMSSSPWWSPKSGPTTDRVESPEKRVSTSWWSRRHSKTASKAVSGSSPFRPTESSSNNIPDRIADSSEKTVVASPSWLKRRNNSNDASFAENNDSRLRIGGGDEEGAVSRQWHTRGRSESLPSSSKFSRPRDRQTSFSETILSRTSEQSPASSSGRTSNYLDKDTPPVSMTRTDDSFEDDFHYRHLREKRNGDLMDSNSSNNNKSERRSNNTTPSSYRSRPSGRTLDLAQELRNSLNRSDMDVNNRLYRNSPLVAEISITDKLKVPLDEVLSLLSTGEKDDHHHTTTANTTDGAVADDHRQAVSSSSSEDETSSNSSEEEWSSVSEDEDEPQEQQQFAPMPPPGRIRRKLPHYIFNRGEATAN